MNRIPFYRTVVIFNCLVPLLMLAWDAFRGQLGVNAVNYAIHVTGILSLLFIVLSLCMSPLRWMSGWAGWIAFRRALGLFGFFYSVLHVAIYIGFDRELDFASTAFEIWMRTFLQIGTAAVVLMVPLAVTSTNAMIQRLGPTNWKLLHRAAYLVAILAVAHYYLLVKSDTRQPIAFGVVVAGLLASRFGVHYAAIRKQAKKAASPSALVARESRAPANRPWKGELRLVAMFQETPTVRTFRFASLDNGPLPFSYRPGQYLTIHLEIDGKRVNRCYTIASSPSRNQIIEITVKQEPLGLASRFIHGHMKVGDSVRIWAPAGKFIFEGKDERGVLLIAGGVGITPLMSMVRYLTDLSWPGRIHLVFMAKSEEEIIFHDELRLIERRHSNLSVCITLTQLNEQSMWKGERGRVTATLLERFVPNLQEYPAFICGPNAMMDSSRELLMKLGVPGERIFTEAFSSSKAISSLENAREPVDEPITADTRDMEFQENSEFQLEFSRSRIACQGATSESILESAERISVSIPFDCRAGICGQCKTKLLSGSVSMESEDALSGSEKAAGWILACQAYPRSDVKIDA